MGDEEKTTSCAKSSIVLCNRIFLDFPSQSIHLWYILEQVCIGLSIRCGCKLISFVVEVVGYLSPQKESK